MKVADRGGSSFKGFRVELAVNGSSAQQRVVTEEDGVARFRGIKPGSYFVSASNGAGYTDELWLQVTAAEPSGKTVLLQWPPTTPLLARSLKGRLLTPRADPGQPGPGLTLEFMEASGRVLNRTKTAENGSFSFPATGAGLYLISVRLSGNDTGSIPIVLDPNAIVPDLDIEIGWTSCGMHYVDHRRCAQEALHLNSFAGRVSDPGQGAIPYAQVLLFDDRDHLVERTVADQAGSFALSRIRPGVYNASVESPGFTSYWTTVTIDAQGTDQRLDVRLSIGGCSSATVQ